VFSSADLPAQDKIPDTSESHIFSWLRDAEVRCLAQLLRRFRRGWRNSMASTFLRGLRPPMDRARVTPARRRRPVPAVGGRVAGPRATLILPRARRS